MKSITLFTEEVDDLEAGVADLLGQLDDFTLLASSVGLLFVPPDVELQKLTGLLGERLGFPIAGATGMALLSDKGGFQESGLSLQIMTADDCSFQAGITGDIGGENLEEETGRLCRELDGADAAATRLVMAYAAVPKSLSAERYLTAIEAALPGVPVFGGSASDDFCFEDARVCYGTEIRRSGAVVILVKGQVRPVLQCVYSLTKEIPLPGQASCCDGIVQRLGDRTLVEALQASGMRSDKSDVVEDFVGMPFVAEMPLPDGDSLRLVRHLMHLDHAAGSGSFIGQIKDGTRLAVSVLTGDYLTESVEQAFRELLPKLAQAEGYCYSTLICISCGARQMVLTGNPVQEGDVIPQLLPASLSLSGFYSFGEICPVSSRQGKEYNAFHNTAFTILAM